MYTDWHCFLPLVSIHSMLFTEFTRVRKCTVYIKMWKKPIKGLWIVDYHMMSSVVLFCFLVFCSCLFCFCFMYFFSERAHVQFWEHDKLLLRLREDNMGGILPLPVFSESLSQPYFNLQNWMEIYRGMCIRLACMMYWLSAQ